MSKRRRPWTRVEPSQELLSSIQDEILDTVRKMGGQAHWSHIYAHVSRTITSGEWQGLTDYGRTKTFNSVLEQLTERRIIYREKAYRPYVLLNPLDLIVEAIDHDVEPTIHDGV